MEDLVPGPVESPVAAPESRSDTISRNSVEKSVFTADLFSPSVARDDSFLVAVDVLHFNQSS